MADEGEVVAAIYHIMEYHRDWRGHLNDDDYRRLKEILDASVTSSHWGNRVSEHVDDTLIGALRNQWPDLFDGPSFRNPPTNVSPEPAPETQPTALPPGVSSPAASPPTDGLSGQAADAATRLDAALTKNRNALNTADDELADAVLRAQTTSQDGKAKLQALQQSIIDEVKKLGPTLDTLAGQRQLAEFLQGKTAGIINIVKNADLDSQSQASILDGLAARYDALTQGGKNEGNDENGASGQSDKNTGTGNAGEGPGGGGASAPLDAGMAGGISPASDPLFNGLASDPLMSGLGALAPVMGAWGGLPSALGSMMPLGGAGGGLPLGDLGSGIGGAVRDAISHPGDHDAEATLKDPGTDSKSFTGDGVTTKADATGDCHHDGHDPAQQVAGAGGDTITPSAGVGPAPAPVPADTTVKLPDGTTQTAASVALAKAGRAIFEGASIEDSYPAADIQLPPLGSTVTAPISPGHLQFGDLGQYNDHRVMALGGNKVWVNGQVTPLDQLQTGPNFLGWQRLAAPANLFPTTALAATANAPH